MRRGTRIASTVVAAGVLVTGAGVALACVTTSGPARRSATGPAVRPGQAGSAVVLDRLGGQAIADQKRLDDVARRVRLARVRVADAERLLAAEKAAQAARAAAAVRRSAIAAQAAAQVTTTWTAPAAPAVGTSPPAPASSTNPPPVHTTTGASGSTAPSGEDGGGSDD